MTDPSSVPDPTRRPDADRDLVVLFTRALRLLGDAGYPVAANRLAGKAWWTLKQDDPKGAQRVSGVMHYLAKLPEETAPPKAATTPDPPTPETME